MDKAERKARKMVGIAEYERENPKYRTPGTAENGRWAMMNQTVNDILRAWEKGRKFGGQSAPK